MILLRLRVPSLQSVWNLFVRPISHSQAILSFSGVVRDLEHVAEHNSDRAFRNNVRIADLRIQIQHLDAEAEKARNAAAKLTELLGL